MTPRERPWDAKARYLVAIVKGRRTEDATDEVADYLGAAFADGMKQGVKQERAAMCDQCRCSREHPAGCQCWNDE